MSLAEPIPRESFRDPTRQLGEGVKQQSWFCGLFPQIGLAKYKNIQWNTVDGSEILHPPPGIQKNPTKIMGF